MIELKTANHSDLTRIAQYMAHGNSSNENRCAFIDNNKSEIFDYLNEIHSSSRKAVIYLEEDSIIVGAVAGDICDDNNTIEVIGPFIDKEIRGCEKYLQQMVSLMQELNKDYRLKFFIDDKNEFVKQFIISNNGMITSSHCNMTLNLEDFAADKNVSSVDAQCVDYTKSLQDENIKQQFGRLHDMIFSTAYYNSDTIIKKINDSNILSCCLVNGKVVSYAFYNTEDEGYIDFIATDKKERGRGFGQLLLKHVLGNLKNRNCNLVRLCVNSENISAINLYRKAGFKITEENQVYSL